MEPFRPEYVQAVSAARWLGTVLTLSVAPVLLVPAVAAKARFGYVGLAIVFLVTLIASWFTLVLTVDHLSDTMIRMAQTGDEWRDATADTARVYAPVFGIPFVVFYCAIWLPAANVLGWAWQASASRCTRRRDADADRAT